MKTGRNNPCPCGSGKKYKKCHKNKKNDKLNIMEEFGLKHEKSEFPVSEALERLQKAADIFRDMELKVIDRNITEDNLASGLPVPIVKDGLNGIRATYSKQRGLKIFFTNGFENPNNSERQEIEKRLKEAELL